MEALLASLNRNGKKEAALHHALSNLVKDQFVELGKQSSSSTRMDTEPREEDIMEAVREYESIYQPQEEYLKGRGRVNRSLHLLEIFRDRIQKTDLMERATSGFLLSLLLELEQEFSNYLRSRKWRWIGM